MQPGGSNSSKLDRNANEKNRRMQMKDLYSRLASLISNQPSKERPPLRDMLDQATSYAVELKQKVEELKRRKAELEAEIGGDEGSSKDESLPIVTVRDKGSTVEVILISGLNKNFKMHEVLSVLKEEGAEVVSASYSTVGNRIFYTFQSQVLYSRIGIETSRVHERLMRLVS